MKTAKYSGIRRPGLAGSFYPANARDITGVIQAALHHERQEIDAHDPPAQIIGGVVPHAGIRYCGYQAVHFFELLKRTGQHPETVVIAHPNHQGYGPEISVDGYDGWETPLGTVEVDTDFSHALQLARSPEAQQEEHSAEVLLPWLQCFLPAGFKILSVNMLHQGPDTAAMLAERIYNTAKNTGRRILFLASSDFSHFLSPEEADQRNAGVLKAILQKKPRAVYEAVRSHQVTVCGFGPIMALMEYAVLVDDAYRIRLLRKGHSGEVSPSDRVVSYVSLLAEAG